MLDLIALPRISETSGCFRCQAAGGKVPLF